MANEPPCAAHVVEIRNDKGDAVTVALDVKFRAIHVLRPIGKQKRYPPLTLTYIHARERDQPTDRDRVEWRLVTNLPVHSAEQAIEQLSWYALRWKIEVFHKIMKAGCRAEEVKLRTAELLVNRKRCTKAPCNRPVNMELSRHDIGTCRGRCGRRDQRRRGG
ncbi:hypothetical protein [Mesorhizobium humile]|uniref:Transposase IS4-like domain-containing protein n=1 Tax=Mesorhizobium humile TaxID=3072313 RepID=A0ABU4YNE0_9HYPH|nr:MULTISPECIES: hypothetical protein [unclassified Mesorhizobium]MDX8463313.1 hypothetical protein [Mesorhizobium sp. VK2D]MDX8488343.1 hypothetical protein [Mesorhizobium sp. VK2B]